MESERTSNRPTGSNPVGTACDTCSITLRYSMIKIIGDIHGNYRVLIAAADVAAGEGAVALIQVGDMGWNPNNINFFKKFKPLIPVLAMDGNHEYHDYLAQFATDALTEVYPNLFFVPRGFVTELDGRKIAFMGGAASIDKALRIRMGWHWSEGENITDEEMRRLDHVESVDLLVTHVPPKSVIDATSDPMNKLRFGVPIDWVDPNSVLIETLWNRLGNPLTVAGHMHYPARGYNYRILDIDETMDF